MNDRPIFLGQGSRSAIGHDRHAQPACDRLHSIEKGPDPLDVVAHVGDEGNVRGRGGRRQRPASLDHTYVVDPVRGHARPQPGQHRRRRIHRDDLAEDEGEGQRVAAGAGPDVQPRLAGPGEAAELGKGWVLGVGPMLISRNLTRS